MLFLGYSGGGKTTALTNVCRTLYEAGWGKIGTIKRIHDRNFSIDTKGKDTHLHSSAGASVVVAFAPNEIDIIKKEKDTSKVSPREILRIFTEAKIDYLLVEGLHKKFEKVKRVKRVICARSEVEAIELIKAHPGKILFLTGRFAKKIDKTKIVNFPVLSLPRDNIRAIELIGRE